MASEIGVRNWGQTPFFDSIFRPQFLQGLIKDIAIDTILAMGGTEKILEQMREAPTNVRFADLK